MTAPRDWRELTHAELYAAVHSGPGPGASMPAEGAWHQLAGIIEGAEARMHAAAARSADAWQGAGGDTARSALGGLNAWALGAVSDAQTTLFSLSNQGQAARELTLLMLPPRTDELVAARNQASEEIEDASIQKGLLDLEQQAQAEAEDARRHMEYYYNVSTENRRNIDFWTTPPSVVVEAASTAPAGGGAVPGSGGGGSISAALSGGGAGRAGGPEAPGFGGVPAVLGAGGAGPPGVPTGAGTPGGGSPGPGGGSAGPGSAGAGSAGPGSAGPGSIGPGPVGPVPGSVAPGSAGSSGSRSGSAPGPSGGGAVPPPAYGRPGGAPPSGSPGPTRRTLPPTGRDALPPGAGGRGPRVPSGGDPGTRPVIGNPGFRPVVPGPQPLPSPSPTWRDLVNSQRGPTGGPPGVPAEPAPGNRGGPVRPGLPAETTARTTGGGSGYGAGHGMYPPMGGAAGNQGEGRRRPSYLIDDSGAFEVNVPYTDPVIGGPDLPQDPRDR